MSLGHKSSGNPAAILASLMNKREKLEDELRSIEKQVFELETNYLQDSSHFGHVLKGFEGFLSSSKNTANLKRSRKFQPEDRLFSLSSVTSPVENLQRNVIATTHAEMVSGSLADELGVRQDDGRSDFGSARSKGGGLAANGQGKPKKGRTASSARDGKRTRPSSEQDFDDEDDPDMSLR
ncbi:chromatin modification-related protein EAF6 [Gossypium australe]|uniref:Chromatin modification-related protein EAF6 n=1 Tax=Gossypium australe TaxID=47621 RepID=A0A5B6WUX9_9ROSI|nr:chromatin modification-related protein EAF6 [Gossypium australe]